MKHLAVLLFALVSGCQTAENESVPYLGERISLPDGHGILMIAAAQISPSTTLTRGGIAYTVAVNDSNRIIYVSSSSSSFKTPEGLSTESTLEQVLAAGGRPLMYETGWAYYSELPSGWRAAFYGIKMDGDKVVELLKEPSLATHVDQFFRRR